MTKSRVLVAQIGARRHYAVARALHAGGLLEQLVTDACADIAPWKWLDSFFPSGNRPPSVSRLMGRHVPGVPPDKIVGYPWFALSAAWKRRRGRPQTDYWARRNSNFCRKVVQDGFGDANCVYAYNGAALEIFEAARKAGVKTVLDQTAAPWRWNSYLLQQERERWPDWEVVPAEVDVSGVLTAREEAEWELADAIVCGSDFVVSAIDENGGPTKHCHVVPYPSIDDTGATGCEGAIGDVRQGQETSGRRHAGEPLRVLFVGTLQLRKGVQYLLAAKRLLRDLPVTMRLVGPSMLSETAMRELAAEMEVVGAVPRAEVAKHYAWADVFVLPTLSDGSANVCNEALAAGLPVITTPNAGSVIIDGLDGILVPAKDPEALSNAINSVRSILSVRGNGREIHRNLPSAVKSEELDRYANALREILSTTTA